MSAGATLRAGIIDCDIHPTPRSPEDLFPFLSRRWRDHYRDYGLALRQPFAGATTFPRSAPALSRRDAWPPGGGPPGSDLAFMRAQHLDALRVRFGILQVLFPAASSEPNLAFSAALSSALNDWQLAAWCDPEPRLKGAIVVPQDDPVAAVAEIEKRAGDRRFAHVALVPPASEPLGRRRYWPIYEAAAAADLPIGLHPGAFTGVPPTGGGWPSYYSEGHLAGSQMAHSFLTSVVLEGAAERFPTLRFTLVEGGFAWVPAMCWRLDGQWARFRSEIPYVKRPPSEYVREQFYFTSQPVEEPDRSHQLREVIDWLGWDRLLFSTDYPHWDFDDPRFAFRMPMTEGERRAIFFDNAARLYGLS